MVGPIQPTGGSSGNIFPGRDYVPAFNNLKAQCQAFINGNGNLDELMDALDKIDTNDLQRAIDYSGGSALQVLEKQCGVTGKITGNDPGHYIKGLVDNLSGIVETFQQGHGSEEEATQLKNAIYALFPKL